MRNSYTARLRAATAPYGLLLTAFLGAACSAGGDDSNVTAQGGGAGMAGNAAGAGGTSASGSGGMIPGSAPGGMNAIGSGGFLSAAGGSVNPATGAGGASTSGGGGSAGLSGPAGAAGAVNAGGAAGSGAGASGAGGAAGSSGGSAGAGGSMPGTTAVCDGGKVGSDSSTMRPPGLTVSREYAAVKYLARTPIQITSFTMTMQVPKAPTVQQTLFIWPGLQGAGSSDPGRIGNGILQPVLTWGSSCAPMQPSNPYAAWWISSMYVNVSSSAAGPTGCLGGDYLVPDVADELFIDMSVKGTVWTQTITDNHTMKSVDLTTDLKGQVQNWATWAIEVPTGETIKPVDDVVFTGSVLTFSTPVTSCQPSQAGTVDYFSAPVLSTDGLHCCFDKVILRANRT